MAFTQRLLAIGMVGVLSACTSVPKEWTTSVQQTGRQVFVHLTCTIDGVGRVALGTLEGGLDGLVKASSLTDQMINDHAGSDRANEIMLAVIGAGATVGLGMGLSENIQELPTAYMECLENQDTLIEKRPLI